MAFKLLYRVLQQCEVRASWCIYPQDAFTISAFTNYTSSWCKPWIEDYGAVDCCLNITVIQKWGTRQAVKKIGRLSVMAPSECVCCCQHYQALATSLVGWVNMDGYKGLMDWAYQTGSIISGPVPGPGSAPPCPV